MTVQRESDLAALASALSATDVSGVTPHEKALLKGATTPDAAVVRATRAAIKDGADPLGDMFCQLRDAETRRPMGATYTPTPIVDAMLSWAGSQKPRPDVVVDPGSGSGRFAVAAGRKFSKAHVVAVELDPLAALVSRAHLATAGMANRSTVILDDFRAVTRPHGSRALYVGNPPYVRHHQIAPDWKDWLTRTAKEHGYSASQLAGLHVHFFLATLTQAQAGDIGCYITAAEWLDVNYGSLVRQLLLDGLGGQAVHVLNPKTTPFADATVSGAIACFEVGSKPTSLRLRRVDKIPDLGKLTGGRPVRRERLIEAPRWTLLMRNSQPIPEGHVELGELCRVHRGTVTGANSVWVAGAAHPKLPADVLTPSVTRARELFAAGTTMASADLLRRVVELPEDLDELDDAHRPAVDRFLKWAKEQGAHQGYIARHRKSWWSVGLRAPAPILATYMARRPPAFVRNIADARHINIAHGLYPRQPLSDKTLDTLAKTLREIVTQSQGRTYAGGLTKFEPREMERILVPAPSM
jgi:hypothetical protein